MARVSAQHASILGSPAVAVDAVNQLSSAGFGTPGTDEESPADGDGDGGGDDGDAVAAC